MKVASLCIEPALRRHQACKVSAAKCSQTSLSDRRTDLDRIVIILTVMMMMLMTVVAVVIMKIIVIINSSNNINNNSNNDDDDDYDDNTNTTMIMILVDFTQCTRYSESASKAEQQVL